MMLNWGKGKEELPAQTTRTRMGMGVEVEWIVKRIFVSHVEAVTT